MAHVQQLVDMGFAEADARRALQEVNCNLEQAIERLLSGEVGGGDTETPLGHRPLPLADLDALSAAGGVAGDGTRDDVVSSNPPIIRMAVPKSFLATQATATDSLGIAALPPPALKDAEYLDLTAALEMSMRDQQDGFSSSPVGGGARTRGLPCGLLNIGNTCYVNSLLQTLLHIEEFRDHMLRYRTPAELAPSLDAGTSAPAVADGTAETDKAGDAVSAPNAEVLGDAASAERAPETEADDSGRRELERDARREHGVALASALRHLFACSLFTTRSCIDPSRLLAELVDPRGQKLHIGSQEDVGEFMLKLLEQLDEGLRAGSFIEPASCSSAGSGLAADPQDAAMSVEEPCSEPAKTTDGQTEGELMATGACILRSESSKDVKTGQGERDTKWDRLEPKRLSLLQTLFFGEQVQFLSYEERASDGDDLTGCSSAEQATELSEGGKAVVSEEESEFLHIFLDVKHKDLYTAWKAAHRTEVDYTTPAGSTTKASTSTWIKRLPNVLLFQLQRVTFNQETKAQVKLDDTFEFDRRIFVDRFLLENKDRVICTETRVAELRRRRGDLMTALGRFEAFHGRPGVGVDEVLEWVAQLVEGTARAAVSSSSPSSPLILLGEAAPFAFAPPERDALRKSLGDSAASTVGLLRSLRDGCLSQAQSLRSEVESLDRQIASAYSDLRHRVYDLQAIWLHSGIAGSGHYFAYVCDRSRGRWFGLNDAVASVVSWDEVREAAVGQKGSNTSAYVLVYGESSLADTEDEPAVEPASLHVQTESVDMSEHVEESSATPPQAAKVDVLAGKHAETDVDAASTASQKSDDERDVFSAALKATEALIPAALLEEIRSDNDMFVVEQRQRELKLAEFQQRWHAEAIFQHYAGLLHSEWEPLKRLSDNCGSAYDFNAKKNLYDVALIRFELFLYRLHGERDVWSMFLAQSVDAQRKLRSWSAADEGRILHFLALALRNRKCYASMLREVAPAAEELAPAAVDGLDAPSVESQARSELVTLDMAKLSVQYNLVLVQAHVMDEALRMLQNDRAALIKSIGMLAFIWARGNLEKEDKFRQNEVLLLISALIYNVANALERAQQTSPEVSLVACQPACEYFLLLLHAIEWPKGWKTPLISRLQAIFPNAALHPLELSAARTGAIPDGALPQNHPTELKEAVLNHMFTQGEARWETYELERPEPGHDFFNRHRTLYAWAHREDEAIAQEFLISQVPALRGRGPELLLEDPAAS